MNTIEVILPKQDPEGINIERPYVYYEVQATIVTHREMIGSEILNSFDDAVEYYEELIKTPNPKCTKIELLLVTIHTLPNMDMKLRKRQDTLIHSTHFDSLNF